MKRYRVCKAHDCLAYFTTVVEAGTPAEARRIAANPDYEGEWEENGHGYPFDDYEIYEDDVTEITADEPVGRAFTIIWSDASCDGSEIRMRTVMVETATVSAILRAAITAECADDYEDEDDGRETIEDLIESAGGIVIFEGAIETIRLPY